MRDRTERPQDEREAMRPAPVYPKCVYGHSATGPRVMNPAFHFVPTAFFPRRARLLHVHFSTRQSMYVGRARLRDNSPARLPILCTYRLHVCPHVGYVRADYSRTAKSGIPARLYTYIAAASHVSHRPPNAEPKILFFPATVRHILTRFSVPLCRRTTARKTCLSMV